MFFFSSPICTCEKLCLLQLYDSQISWLIVYNLVQLRFVKSWEDPSIKNIREQCKVIFRASKSASITKMIVERLFELIFCRLWDLWWSGNRICDAIFNKNTWSLKKKLLCEFETCNVYYMVRGRPYHTYSTIEVV